MNRTFIKLILAGILSYPLTGVAITVSGQYEGTFISPTPPSPPSVTTGIGTNNVTWGIPCDGVTNCFTSPGGVTPPSSFKFTSVPFVTELNVPFVLGEIEYFNGTIFPGTEITQVTLFLDSIQISPTQFAGSDSRVITVVNTPNSSDPIASADRATIPMAFFPGADAFGVLESKSATATVLGQFSENSPELINLNILGYGEVTDGDGFLEGVAPVPLPAAVWLFAIGVGVLGSLGRRRSVS